MYVRIVAEKYNVLFECTRIVEKKTGLYFFTGIQGDVVHTELLFGKEEGLSIFAMNDSGKTIDSWNIYPEGKPKD